MGNNKKDIDTYKQRIKRSGFRLTGTRMVILDILLKSPGELDAEELFFLSHKKHPRIGQATIYRTLKLLEKEGLIDRTGYKDKKAKYKIKKRPGLGLRSAGSKPKQYSPDKNKREVDTGSKIRGDISHPSGTGHESAFESHRDMERINVIQSQLTEWLGDLDKIKREKELVLEEAMEDFGEVDKVIDHHNCEKSNLIQILLDIQNEYNWLPRHILLYLGKKLDIPLTDIYSITTFYKYFNLEPQGKYSIVACMGTACHVRGAMNLLQRITSVLGVKPGDTTSDYRFTLKTVNCLGCCALGPVVMVDNKYYSNPSASYLKKILKQLS